MIQAQALAAANRSPREKYTTDHSQYLERKDRRLKSTQEMSIRKLQQTERRLKRLHGTSATGK